MNSYFYIFLYLSTTLSLNAKVLSVPERKKSPTEMEATILNYMLKEAGWDTKTEPVNPNGKNKKVNKNENQNRKIIKEKQERPSPSPRIDKAKSKQLTAGEKKIQEILKKNREKLANKSSNNSQISSGTSIVEEMKRKNREKLKQIQKEKRIEEKNNQDRQKSENSYSNLREEYLNTLTKWKKTTNTTYSRWKEKQKIFLKNLKYYKENTFNINDFNLQNSNIQTYKMNKNFLKTDGTFNTKNLDNIDLIKSALDIPVRDQGRRPTCAAFAGVRAIEILLASNNLQNDLSEQYFYWLSKPDCQYSPCSQRGSWVLKGFRKSKAASYPDIPNENHCNYDPFSKNGNETQIPLARDCSNNGLVQVAEFYQLTGINQILASLEEKSPVVAGFKLTPNFYNTSGIVKYENMNVGDKTDSHAAGHALVIVGHMKLPKDMHKKEGRICFIVTNSWGEGWGAGGHGCLTEKWVKSNIIEHAYISLSKIKTK